LAGIYVHIPFCKQSCYYCNFHFSTSDKKRGEVLNAIEHEIAQKARLSNEKISTIYFGGGTPSILDVKQINSIINKIHKEFKVEENAEITLEANPDDLKINKVIDLSKTKINRLSIGVQSFIDRELKAMNRAHDSKKAMKSLELSKKYFDNISIDLIYGVPDSNLETWAYNLEVTMGFDVNHVSTYALTIEPKTALESFVRKLIVDMPKEGLIYKQYNLINEKLEPRGFINYEVCSFAKENFFSKNNSAYWLRKKYIGIGPSAHSFDGKSRSWNISNNKKYVEHINDGRSYHKREELTTIDQYNEYVMTGFRTIWGVSTEFLETNFNLKFKHYFIEKIQKHIDQKNIILNDNVYTTTKKGRFLADGIASDLFLLNLK
tara:strand:- start:1471 stop:2601 length:1131 start_codon:yes stop_codon:yes gene_type:complete